MMLMMIACLQDGRGRSDRRRPDDVAGGENDSEDDEHDDADDDDDNDDDHDGDNDDADGDHVPSGWSRKK